MLAPRPAPSTTKPNVKVERKDEGRKEKEEKVEKCKVELIKTEEGKTKVKDDMDDECCCGCTEVSTPPAAMPPPWCWCPRLTIPCDCEDPELCGAFF
ncbi:hypothetical protein BAE44_0023141 [Dichanthelium oligosanthes]|uniref:Uncharacterized protein n=1 Tax=Dichanthelium oligosanthes TaxID=888268 RepID=A0A1E5USK9_9POAL|nr:hypothetical protein BAE44_0023141 [Dichanthelium oligosanthes]